MQNSTVKICPVKISVCVLLLPCLVILHGQPFLLGKGGRGILGESHGFKGGRWGINRGRQSIKGRLEKIGCQLIAAEGGGLKECQRASWGDRVNFIVTQPKCSNPPPPAIKNEQFPKGLMLLQFFESYVTFEECKYNFFGNKRSTIDTKFALIS